MVKLLWYSYYSGMPTMMGHCLHVASLYIVELRYVHRTVRQTTTHTELSVFEIDCIHDRTNRWKQMEATALDTGHA